MYRSLNKPKITKINISMKMVKAKEGNMQFNISVHAIEHAGSKH